MFKEEVVRLTLYRATGKGNINYMAHEFTPDQIIERRSYMRRILRGTMFDNSSNDVLDGMRAWPEPINGGFFVEDVNGYEFIFPNKKISLGEIEFRKLMAMMPPEYMDLTGKDFDWSLYGEPVNDARDTINKFITAYEAFKEKGMGLYIFSKTKGSGKTMLACCILNEISKRYIGSVKFINSLDFLEMTKKGFSYDNPDIEAIFLAKVLVIDDIGVQLDKSWIDTVFYRLINNRYVNGKITIYTSNIAINDLKMDDRIIDRIESTSFEVHLPEVPIRQQLKKAEKEKMMDEIKNAP